LFQRGAVEAMCGTLSIVAEFPDRRPVVLAALGEGPLPLKTADRKPARL
jgi:hypothetical protein